MKIRNILPVHVREWVTKLSAAGVSPAQVRHMKIILSAVFTTALGNQAGNRSLIKIAATATEGENPNDDTGEPPGMSDAPHTVPRGG